MADCHTVMMRQETVSNSLPKDNIDPSLSKRMSAMHLIHYSALYNDRKPPKSHLKRVTAYHGWLCQQLMFYSVVSGLISADGSLIRMHCRSVQMRVKHEEAESVLVLLYIRFIWSAKNVTVKLTTLFLVLIRTHEQHLSRILWFFQTPGRRWCLRAQAQPAVSFTHERFDIANFISKENNRTIAHGRLATTWPLATRSNPVTYVRSGNSTLYLALIEFQPWTALNATALSKASAQCRWAFNLALIDWKRRVEQYTKHVSARYRDHCAAGIVFHGTVHATERTTHRCCANHPCLVFMAITRNANFFRHITFHVKHDRYYWQQTRSKLRRSSTHTGMVAFAKTGI